MSERHWLDIARDLLVERLRQHDPKEIFSADRPALVSVLKARGCDLPDDRLQQVATHALDWLAASDLLDDLLTHISSMDPHGLDRVIGTPRPPFDPFD